MAVAALQLVLGLSVVAHWAYALLAVVASGRWRSEPRPSPPAGPPPVSILKPLCGADAEQLDNLASFCRQDYPEYEVVFGALDADDPALDNARLVATSHPDVAVTVVAGADEFGLNRKVCVLQGLLGVSAHPVLVLCDSDMRVGADYLARVVAPLSVPGVGLVTCAYRGALARGMASRLESLAIGCDFIPSVFVARMLSGLGFALGATIALRRDTLDAIGGFVPLADELADDYRLGERVRGLGRQVVLSDVVVDNVMGHERFGAMWSRRVRWAKTCRAMQPAGWAGSFVTHGLVLSLAFVAACGGSGSAWAVLALTAVLRALTAAWITWRATGDREASRGLWLLPVSDLLSFAVWAASFVGRTVVWRGRRFRLGRGGVLRNRN